MSLLMQPCTCSICLSKPKVQNPDNSKLKSLFKELMQWLHAMGEFNIKDIKTPIVQSMISETATVYNEAVDMELTSVEPSDILVRSLKQSGYVFSGFKTLAQIKEAEQFLLDDEGNIKPFERYLNDVRTINETYNETYLFSEYKFAVSSSQMADKWVKFAKDGDRYDLQYRTANDSRVRDTHAELHNITLPIDSPFWDEYFPPNGWGCRCTVVQVRKGKFPTSNIKEAIEKGKESTSGSHAKMFRFNPGKSKSLFPPHNPYTPSKCSGCSISGFPLAKIPTNELCKACPIVREMVSSWDKKKHMKLGEADRVIKELMSNKKQKTIKASSLKTGTLYLSHDAVKRYLGHAKTSEAKWLIETFQDNADLFEYVKYTVLGEVKDMNNKKDALNILKKRQRKVQGYNSYRISVQGEVWTVGFEVIKKGDKLYEQPYFVVNKKKKS